MQIDIVRATADDIPALVKMDKKCFNRFEDQADESYYTNKDMRTFWVLRNSRRIGSTSVMHHRTYSEKDGVFSKRSRGTLYIVSTGILPRQRRLGIGGMIKAFHVAYAKEHEFSIIITHTRATNLASIRLNKKFGFVETGRLPSYYSGGEDAIVLMLVL